MPSRLLRSFFASHVSRLAQENPLAYESHWLQWHSSDLEDNIFVNMYSKCWPQNPNVLQIMTDVRDISKFSWTSSMNLRQTSTAYFLIKLVLVIFIQLWRMLSTIQSSMSITKDKVSDHIFQLFIQITWIFLVFWLTVAGFDGGKWESVWILLGCH
jgi:hypothetical protein